MTNHNYHESCGSFFTGASVQAGIEFAHVNLPLAQPPRVTRLAAARKVIDAVDTRADTSCPHSRLCWSRSACPQNPADNRMWSCWRSRGRCRRCSRGCSCSRLGWSRSCGPRIPWRRCNGRRWYHQCSNRCDRRGCSHTRQCRPGSSPLGSLHKNKCWIFPTKQCTK